MWSGLIKESLTFINCTCVDSVIFINNNGRFFESFREIYEIFRKKKLRFIEILVG